jgi:long-chain acyl-CoA synthetase
MNRQSLAEYVEDFRRYGSGTAFVHRRGYRTVRWSYREIAEAASQVARLLEQRGVQPGERVLLWGENCGEWVAAFYGCVLRGAVVVPLDKIASPEFAGRVAQQVQARMALGTRELLPHLPGVSALAFEEFPAALAALPPSPYAGGALARTDLLQIIFTSGATADPKGVVITHGNVLANLTPLETEIAKYLKYERIFHPVRFLNLLPLSHVFGQFMGIFVPQLLRGTVLFQETLRPSEVVRTIKRQRVSVLVVVPRMLDALKDRFERAWEAQGRLEAMRRAMEAAKDLKFTRRWWRFREVHHQFGWKFWAMISGGAALDAATEEFWRRLSFVVVQGYGMTETTSLVSVNHPFGVGRGSIGKVLAGREIKLADNGEILVRGESVASAYWQGGEMKPVAGDNGWLRTGDLGAVDAQGNLYFKGRQKNVIVTPEGMNVYPEDLESALRQQPGVRDCLVLPLPRDGNAVPGAVLLLRDSTADAAQIVQRANESLAEFQRIRQWLVWPEEDFPRTATHKPRANAILEVARVKLGLDAAHQATAAAVGQAGSLGDLVASIAGRGHGAGAADIAQLSSLERVELMSAMEDRYQVDLNEAQFTAATTLNDLEKLLRESSGAESPAAHHYPRWAQRWPATWIRPLIYHLITWPATQILSAPRIFGRERLRGLRGPALLVCNHITYADIGFVLAALPMRWRKLAVAMQGEMLRKMRRPPADWLWWEKLLAPLSYWLMTPLFNVFPLPQRSGFRESFQFAGESADRGYSVLVFPEGARTKDGKIAPFRSGTGLLAANLRLPVIPLRIFGLWELKARGRRGFAPHGAIQIVIGDPLRFPPETPPEGITPAVEAAVRGLQLPS